MDSQDDVVNTGPLSSRVEDKNWKTRVDAYNEVKSLFTNALGDDPVFDEYAGIMPKMATDSNAGALDAGLECVLVFADLAPVSCIRQQANSICSGVVDKAFGANKASSVQSGRAIVLKLMEADDTSTCTAILLNKLSDKKPKVPPGCITLLKEGVEAFGIRAFPVRDIISALPPVFAGSNSAAKEAAMALMVEMTRWIGVAPFNSLVDGLKSAQKTDFEKLCEAASSEKPVPTLWLRKDRPSPGSAPVARSSGEAKESGGKPAPGPTGDAREFVEEVDLLKRLKATNYQELIVEEKWSEQLKGLQLIIEIIGPTPKIKPGTDTHDIIDVLKAFLRQGHVQLQTSSLRIVALLADGLRGEFALTVRPLTQSIIMKCKEKRLLGEVTLAMQNILKYCLGFESMLEDICEHIRNKKTPPHGRVCLMEFTIEALRDLGDRVANDSLKPLADACVSVCEDSDPKVRDTVAKVLAQLAVTVRSRGRAAVEAHRVLTGLETSAPRVYKKMQAELEGATATAAAPPAASTAAATRPKTAPVAQKEPVAEKGPVDKAPVRAGGMPKRPTTGAPTKKKATGSSSSGQAAQAPATTAAEDDNNVDDLAMSGEEAAAALEALGIPNWTSVMAKLSSSKWQDKGEGYDIIGEFVKANEMGGNASAALVALVKDQNPGLKVTNVNVFKSALQAISACAENPGSGPFSRPAAMEVLRAWGDKIGDRKTKDGMETLLTALLETISAGFVLKRMSQVLDKVKAPLAHQYYLEWLKKVVSDFGPAIFPVQSTAAFCHLEMENKSAPVRTGAVEVLGEFYHHLGPRFMSIAFTDDMKPASKTLLEAEFEKVGFDPAAAAKLSKAPKGQAAAAIGGAIPRVDLSKALESSVVGDLAQTNGKNSWETRKAAMEAIIQACERSGHFVEGNVFAKGLLKSLKERLNDTQANLKPLAVTTMGHVIRAMDMESAVRAFRVLSGPLLAGVADNKKSMRDATLAALTMVVTQGIPDNASRPDANLVGALVPALAEAAQNPVGRTELLAFFVNQVDSEAVLKCEWTDVMTSIVLSLQDKTPTCRAAAEQLFCSLINKGYVSRSDAAKSFRDLSPAVMRSLQSVMDRIVSSTVEGGVPSATASASLATTAPATTEHVAKSARDTARPTKTERSKPAPSHEDIPVAAAPQEVPDVPTSATFPLKKTSKAKRLDDFYKQNWPQPPEDPGATEMNALKSAWEGLIAPELFQIVFEDNKSGLANQDSVMGAMSELMSLLSGDEVGATSGMQYGSGVNDMVVQHTDFILRWTALALCLRESTSGLMHVLLLISKVFDKIQHVNGQLHEAEISVILPALIERSGHKSERHKSAFKSVISAARRVVPSSRLCQLLVQGLKCKNKKSRVVCIEVIDLIIAESGPAVLGKQGIRDVGATFDTRDLDVGVRNAALDFCYTLYTCVGSDKDKLMKLLGPISEKAVPMIMHRIKEKEKQRGSEPTLSHDTTTAPVHPQALTQAPEPKVAPRPVETNTRRADDVHAGYVESVSAPQLTLTPLDDQREGGFYMEDDGDAPFRLEMTPPDGAAGSMNSPAGGDTWRSVDSPSRAFTTTTRRISLEDEKVISAPVATTRQQSDNELESICLDIWDKVDALLASKSNARTSAIYADILQDAKEYMKIAHAVMRNEWCKESPTEADKEALLRQLPACLDRVLKCLSFGFSNALVLPETGIGADAPVNSVAGHRLSKSMDIGLVSVSLAVLFALLDRADFCRGISEMSVRSIIEEGVRHLVDSRLNSSPDDEVTKQISKGLNALVLKVACTGTIKPGLVMCAIVDNLILCIPEKRQKQSLPVECAKPLSRLLLKLLREEMARGDHAAFRMPNVDSMRVLAVLNGFFNNHPASPPSDDTPYCSAKTFLAQMLNALGEPEVLRICAILKIPDTSFLCRLIHRMTGSVTSDSYLSSSKPQSSGTDDGIREQIVSIIDRITSSRDKILPIRELHQLLRDTPADVDISSYLQPLSSTFRKFVLDTLAKLDAESPSVSPPRMQMSSSRLAAESSYSSSPSPRIASDSSEGGDGSEALRILEGLKAKPRQYRSGSNAGTSLQSVGGDDASVLSEVSTISRPSMGRASSQNRALIQDKVKGSLSSLSASLSMDPGPGSPLAAASGSSSASVTSISADGDLAARLQRLKRMDPNSRN